MAIEGPGLHGRLERVDRHRDAGRLQRRHDRCQPADLLVGPDGLRIRVARRCAEIVGVCAVAREAERMGDGRVGIQVTAAARERVLGQIHDPEDSAARQITPSRASSRMSSSPSPRRPLYTASLSAPSAGAPRSIRPGVREKRG